MPFRFETRDNKRSIPRWKLSHHAQHAINVYPADDRITTSLGEGAAPSELVYLKRCKHPSKTSGCDTDGTPGRLSCRGWKPSNSRADVQKFQPAQGSIQGVNSILIEFGRIIDDARGDGYFEDPFVVTIRGFCFHDKQFALTPLRFNPVYCATSTVHFADLHAERIK